MKPRDRLRLQVDTNGAEFPREGAKDANDHDGTRELRGFA
jgi:hypothetical protein